MLVCNDGRHKDMKGVPPISCKISIINFNFSTAKFSDFLKYKKVTIKTSDGSEEADKFLCSFIKEASEKKSLGQLKNLTVGSSPSLFALDDKPELGLTKIFSGEKLCSDEEEETSRRSNFYILELGSEKLLCVEVEENEAYEFNIVDNRPRCVFQCVLDGMLKYQDDVALEQTNILEKLSNKKFGEYQAIIERYFVQLRKKDGKAIIFSESEEEDEEDIDTDYE